MKEKNRLRQRAEFLYPLRLIRHKRLSKKDVKGIQDTILLNMMIIRLIFSILLFLFSLGMMFAMEIATGWQQFEVFGFSSFVAQIVSIVSCAISISLIVTSLIIGTDKTAVILNRIAAIVLFLGIALQMLLGIYADTVMGFTTSQETLSASIIFLGALIVIQSPYWIDSLILDLSTFGAVIGLSIYCASVFKMKALHYYIVIAVAFLLCAYFIVTLLFYAECQRYNEVIENEKLTDKAYYDSLTQCKNRHSLTLYLENNAKRWENEDNLNLLMALFDIDNFKEYNDQFSHLKGDQCLKAVADVVRKTFPYSNLPFFRYGGEEFLLFLEFEDPSEAVEALNKLRNATKELKIEAPDGAPNKYVTISIGATLINHIDDFDFDVEMGIVDKCLYKAKGNGKDVSCLDGRLIK